MGWLFLGERRMLDYCLHCVKLQRQHFHLIKKVSAATWRLLPMLLARVPVGPDLKYIIETIIKRKCGCSLHVSWHLICTRVFRQQSCPFVLFLRTCNMQCWHELAQGCAFRMVAFSTQVKMKVALRASLLQLGVHQLHAASGGCMRTNP